MLHTFLLAFAFGLFILGSFYRQSRININAIGLAVLTVAMFVGTDLHIHLHMDDENGTQKSKSITLKYYSMMPQTLDVHVKGS